MREQDRAIHDWYRFVLSYPPHLVGNYIERFGLASDARILDPFCGTGTTPVECKKRGLPSVGIEANPMAHFACTVKLDWDINPDAFLAHSQIVAMKTARTLEQEGLPDHNDLPLFGLNASHRKTGGFRSLTKAQWDILSPGWISPLPLHRTLTLLECLRAEGQRRWTNHQLLALARALPSEIGNVTFGPEVGCGEPKEDSPAVEAWLKWCRVIADDLRNIRPELRNVESQVYRADARSELPLSPRSIDAVITSPPYPNEKDYTRTTRLESVLLGFLKDRHDLKVLKAGMLRSNTRGVYKTDSDDRFVDDIPSILDVARRIEERRIELGKTSGFERLYARVTKLYFGGMRRHLAALSHVLKPGAMCAYVVGDQASYLRVMIRTGQLLAEVAERVGYKVESIDLFRERYATASKEWLREEVVVLRWPGDD